MLRLSKREFKEFCKFYRGFEEGFSMLIASWYGRPCVWIRVAQRDGGKVMLMNGKRCVRRSILLMT